MDISALLIIFALLVLVGLFVSRPLMEKRNKTTAATTTSTRGPDHHLSTLLAERDRVVNTLQELEFDHALGKVPEDDYARQRDTLLRHGAHVLMQIDESHAAVTAGESSPEQIERTSAVTEKKGTSKEITSEVATIDEIEMMLAEKRRKRSVKAAGFCSQCGGVLHKSDVFCPKCGAKLG
jgi:rubrerythrin